MTLWSEIINATEKEVQEKYSNVDIDCEVFYSANLFNVKEVSFNYKADGNKIDDRLLDAITALRQITHICEIYLELDPKEKNYNLPDLLQNALLAEFNIYIRKPLADEFDDFVRLSEELAKAHSKFDNYLRPLWPVTPIIRDLFRHEILKEKAPAQIVIGEQVVHLAKFNTVYENVTNETDFIKLASEKIRQVVYNEIGGEAGFKQIAQQAAIANQQAMANKG